MDINDLTIGQARELVALFGEKGFVPPSLSQTAAQNLTSPIPVLVCTDKRGVVFGYTTNASAEPIDLTNARMCLYWSADVGGVFGLAEVGPTKDCKISAPVATITLKGVTCVMSVDDKAVKAWTKAPVQGR